MMTFSLDAETNILQVHLDRPGMIELQATLAELASVGGHTHIYDLPTMDLYGQKGAVEVVIDYVDDDLTEDEARLRSTMPQPLR